jgi:hypothetical protein
MSFDDNRNPCPCPPEVVAWLKLAVDYVIAGAGNEHPDRVMGAWEVKTFMEQPAEVWCNYVSIPDGEVTR